VACCPLRRSRVADVAITAEIATTPALFAPLRAAPLEPVRRTAGHLTAFNQDRLLLQVHSYSTGVVSLKPAAAHTLSVVIPVFQGSRTLPALLAEIDEYTRPFPTPHGLFRNTASWGAKAFAKLVAGDDASTHYQSYRLILGEVGRSVAAYAGAGVYLDVALGWVAGDVASAPIVLRSTEIRKSGYSFWRLLSHFWRMIISSGTRGLRLLSILGAIAMVAGVAVAIALIVARIGGGQLPAGWTSTMVVSLITSGLILFSLGIVAEYLGVAVSMAMGKPLYLIVSDPKVGPLGRSASADPARKHQQAPRSS